MLFESIKSFFATGVASPADNPDFIRILQLIDEDERFARLVQRVLDLEPFHRASFLNTMIHELGLKGAPREHLRILRDLTDDSICDRIRSLRT